MKLLLLTLLFAASELAAPAQAPKIEPGVSHDLAVWRAAHYSDIRYKLGLTLEKMSPVLKGTLEIRVNVAGSVPPAVAGGAVPPIILDWVRVADREKDSSISNVTLNGKLLKMVGPSDPIISHGEPQGVYLLDDEHLYFSTGVILGENIIKLDLTSPITTGDSTITRKISETVGLDLTTPTLASSSTVKRYIEKKDGSEYVYSLFTHGNVSTAFPSFDQPDLKARFLLLLTAPADWQVVSNTVSLELIGGPIPKGLLCSPHS
ncbi:MAG TPA: hypothetical protein VGJ02_07630, partial [Pyrinomonadaceae bacterium]